MNDAPLLIKIGGEAVDRVLEIPALWRGLAKLHEAETARGSGVVLVHGGGAAVDRLLGALGLPVVRTEGIRVTPIDQIDHVVAVLAGKVNKRLVGALRVAGANPVGLSLADGGIATARAISARLSRVGEIIGGDPALVRVLWGGGFLPVISSIAHDDAGHALNVNADDAAAGLARTLGARAVVFLTDVPGVLSGDGKFLDALTLEAASALIDKGVIAGGMAAKVRAAMHAVEVTGVGALIASWNDPGVMGALMEGRAPGTSIVADQSPSLSTQG